MFEGGAGRMTKVIVALAPPIMKIKIIEHLDRIGGSLLWTFKQMLSEYASIALPGVRYQVLQLISNFFQISQNSGYVEIHL